MLKSILVEKKNSIKKHFGYHNFILVDKNILVGLHLKKKFQVGLHDSLSDFILDIKIACLKKKFQVGLHDSLSDFILVIMTSCLKKKFLVGHHDSLSDFGYQDSLSEKKISGWTS
jgi:hypothetical protein